MGTLIAIETWKRAVKDVNGNTFQCVTDVHTAAAKWVNFDEVPEKLRERTNGFENAFPNGKVSRNIKAQLLFGSHSVKFVKEDDLGWGAELNLIFVP
ncbi:hypothetical protein Acj9p038 [Acinetobacter phage Acj9]|uniref:Uncharacterized protein n=1 Tax=Acinetobacter phage Acj9 TaxID=760939 RepID=E5EPH2_9CAUD|nr:hypothetical protein Acj9p038 [Acinetobacter phage Acj9]ADG59938.1 hypothetical protein Acj9p038 [Acinetobacter phage Acj9]